MTRRPDPGAFLRSRLERGTFVGLPLTILAAAFILVAVS